MERLKAATRFLGRRPVILFLFVLLLVYGFTGIYTAIPSRPQGAHQWAQTDRASIALRYYEDGMNFFRPALHNIENGNGITGCEFPGLAYGVALLYKIFGYHEWLYRVSMLLIISFGLLAAFDLSRGVIGNALLAGLLTLTWYLSPVMVIYSANFLPDTAGLGFSLIAWWAFFRLHKRWSWKVFLVFFISIAMACLTKVSCGISAIAMLGLLFLDRMKIRGKSAPFPRAWPQVICILLVFVLTYAWYAYAAYLSEKYVSGNFLLRPNFNPDPGKVLSQAWLNWGGLYYSPANLYLIGFSLVAWAFVRPLPRMVLLSGLLLLLGSVAIFLLLSDSYRDHDYYFIPLMPFAFFFLVILGRGIRSVERWPRIVLTLLLGYVFLDSIAYAGERHRGRYSLASDSVFSDYFDLGEYLEQKGVEKDAVVLSMYDESPDISLYLMNRRGFTQSQYLPEWYMLADMYERTDYVVQNAVDTPRFASVRNLLRHEVGRHRGLTVYRLQITPDERNRFFAFGAQVLNEYYMEAKADSFWNARVLQAAEIKQIPYEWAMLRSVVGALYYRYQEQVIPHVRDRLPQMITEDGAVSYSLLDEEGRQELDLMEKQVIFTQEQMRLIRLDPWYKLANYKDSAIQTEP